MKKDSPFIHAFKTCGSYYVFDVNTNTIIKTTKKNYDSLKSIEKSEWSNDLADAEADAFIQKMKSRGFLSANRVKEILHPATRYLDSYLESGVQKICLQVTQQCNLRCEYCVYSGNYTNRSHTNARMSFETARKAIDFLIEHSRGIEDTNISFYGGEPILEFELMKKCILYALQASEGKTVTFNLTTNGTLFTKDIIEFFRQYNVHITISLDGPREVHNKNRRFAAGGGGTFDKIMQNLMYISDNYEEYFKEKVAFNLVLDGDSDFTCVNSFFTSYEVIKDSMVRASYISENYAKFQIDKNEENDIQTDYELFKLYLSKLDRLDNCYVSKLVEQKYNYIKDYLADARYRTVSLSETAHPGGPCIPGVLRLFVDVNGSLYPCERVDENSDLMKIGNLEEGFYKEKIERILNIGKLTEGSCRNCWAFHYCSVCAAVADDNGELSAAKKLSKCNAVRNGLEKNMINYCILKEYGHNFEENKVFLMAEVK